MKTSETTKPLYQRLNEERSWGNWGVIRETETSIIVASDTTRIDNRCRYILEIKQQRSDGCINEPDRINIQYTVLAVNNLHHLAEVLNDFYVIAESMARYPDKYPEWDSEKSKERFKKLEEALNRIS